MNLRNLIPYIIVIVFAVLIRTFIITPIEVVGNSMEPNLKNGNYMLLNKIGYKLNGLKRFDIIVIKMNEKYIIKRVIGLPNESVYMKNGDVYINDKKLKQKFDINKSYDDYTILDNGYYTIPSNMYFVLGDNRSNSIDSRVIGLISSKDILGKTCCTIFPFFN